MRRKGFPAAAAPLDYRTLRKCIAAATHSVAPLLTEAADLDRNQGGFENGPNVTLTPPDAAQDLIAIIAKKAHNLDF